MMNAETAAIAAGHSEEVERPDEFGNHVFGFWVYMMTDIIIFATLFATFGVVGFNYAGGPTGKEIFKLPDTLAETLLLLFSSATYGLVMLAVTRRKKNWALLGLAITCMLGFGFIAMEIHEFYTMVAEGHTPDRSSFLSAYFTLVATHGTHVTLGLLWMLVMMLQVSLKGFTARVQSRMMRLSMFWHFLDVVWIGIFTIVYLMESI